MGDPKWPSDWRDLSPSPVCPPCRYLFPRRNVSFFSFLPRRLGRGSSEWWGGVEAVRWGGVGMEGDGSRAGEVGKLLDFGLMFSIIFSASDAGTYQHMALSMSLSVLLYTVSLSFLVSFSSCPPLPSLSLSSKRRTEVEVFPPPPPPSPSRTADDFLFLPLLSLLMLLF